MNNDTRVLADGLKTAMKMETDGYHFYLMAANSTGDPKGRQVFETLAEEELGHRKWLAAQYRAVTESGSFNPAVSLGTPADLSGESPVFTTELVARAAGAGMEMSALSIGIQLELASIRFYEKLAQEQSDPVARRFFAELAEWESGHYHALLRQQELLKRDYWAEGGFAPF